MRALFALLALLLASPAPAAPSPFDPVALNEQAAAAVRAGDRGLALILLERAARLAPDNEAIARNVRALRESVGEIPASPRSP